MYDFQASEPDSRPPPVAFSPPKAPPISAPEGPMLTLAMPQYDAARNTVAAPRAAGRGHALGPGGVGGDEARRQARGHVVGQGDGVVEVVVAEHVEDRRERLVLHER